MPINWLPFKELGAATADYGKFRREERERDAATERQQMLDAVKILSDLRKAGYTPKDMESMAVSMPGDGTMTFKSVGELSERLKAYEKALGKGLGEAEAAGLGWPGKRRRITEEKEIEAGFQTTRDYRQHRLSMQRKQQEMSDKFANDLMLLNKRLDQDWAKFQSSQDKSDLDKMSASINSATKTYLSNLAEIQKNIDIAPDDLSRIKWQQLRVQNLSQYKFRMLAAANAAASIYESMDENPPSDIMAIYLMQRIDDTQLQADIMEEYGYAKGSEIIGQARWYNTLFGQKEFVEHPKEDTPYVPFY